MALSFWTVHQVSDGCKDWPTISRPLDIVGVQLGIFPTFPTSLIPEQAV